MKGEKFLNKLYPNLAISDEVNLKSKGTKNKDEALKKYLDHLEHGHAFFINHHQEKKLKKLYHDAYVVKEKDIPNDRDKSRIINAQEESLDRWLDYLLDENTRYPMWVKYWAFQGMIRIGTFNEQTSTYQKRSAKTLAPFIDINPEILSRCIGMVTNYVYDNKLTGTDLDKLIESGNFQKLYTFLLSKQKKNISSNSNPDDGIWITYHYETKDEAEEKEKKGIEPEYLKLYNSLQGYNTGWCTAGDKEVTKRQICGHEDYLGGDFYVYYTKDENGEYKIPRIAIRMDRNDIGEIRGIEDNQNIEDGLEGIVGDKIRTFENLTEDNINKYLKIISNMKRLTLLNKKNRNKEEFTEDDIVFIYELEEKIEDFGWTPDKRIKEIIESRDKKRDLNISENIRNKVEKKAIYTKAKDDVSMEENLALLKHIDPSFKRYREMCLEAVRKYGEALEFVDLSLRNDREICLEAVRNNGRALKWVDPTTEGYREMCLESVRQYGYTLSHVDPTVEGYREICLEAVKSYGPALIYVNPKLKKDREICLEAVRQNGLVLEYVDSTVEGYREICLEALKQDGHALKYVDSNLKKYIKKWLEALKQRIIFYSHDKQNKQDKQDKQDKHM